MGQNNWLIILRATLMPSLGKKGIDESEEVDKISGTHQLMIKLVGDKDPWKPS